MVLHADSQQRSFRERDRRGDGKIVAKAGRKRREALEATILVMIETVKEGENERPATAAWSRGYRNPITTNWLP